MAIYLDHFLSSRIRLSAQFMNKYEVKLFGQEIDMIGTRAARLHNVSSMILDNAYVRCLLLYGALYFVTFCIAYMVLINSLLVRQEIALALICIYYVLVGFGESYMLYPIYNIGLLCFLGIVRVRVPKDKNDDKIIHQPLLE